MDDLELLEALAEREVARRSVPPYRPDYQLIACRSCGKRIHDDDGRVIHRWWWDWWPW